VPVERLAGAEFGIEAGVLGHGWSPVEASTHRGSAASLCHVWV
jgi:hypothetical protein